LPCCVVIVVIVDFNVIRMNFMKTKVVWIISLVYLIGAGLVVTAFFVYKPQIFTAKNNDASVQSSSVSSIFYSSVALEQPISISSSSQAASIMPESVEPITQVPVVIPEVVVEPVVLATPVATPPPIISANSTCNSMWGDEFLGLLNNYRTLNGQNTLYRFGALDVAACNHSNWMSTTGNLDHIGVNGSSPWNRCQAAGSNCDAENIAMSSGYLSPVQAFEMWKNSPGHNTNMLATHTMVGLGYSGGYATNVFY
jgi:uncharacterized protein YkwD